MRLLSLVVAVSMFGCATASSSTTAAPVAAGPSSSPSATEVNPFGKLYEGEGVTVEMAMLAQKNDDGLNDVLLRISGAEAFNEGINGKVIKYVARPASRDGVDFVTQVNGADYVRMLSRDRSFEVYLGHKSYPVWLNETKSKDVDTKKIVADLGK